MCIFLKKKIYSDIAIYVGTDDIRPFPKVENQQKLDLWFHVGSIFSQWQCERHSSLLKTVVIKKMQQTCINCIKFDIFIKKFILFIPDMVFSLVIASLTFLPNSFDILINPWWHNNIWLFKYQTSSINKCCQKISCI